MRESAFRDEITTVGFAQQFRGPQGACNGLNKGILPSSSHADLRRMAVRICWTADFGIGRSASLGYR